MVSNSCAPRGARKRGRWPARTATLSSSTGASRSRIGLDWPEPPRRRAALATMRHALASRVPACSGSAALPGNSVPRSVLCPGPFASSAPRWYARVTCQVTRARYMSSARDTRSRSRRVSDRPQDGKSTRPSRRSGSTAGRAGSRRASPTSARSTRTSAARGRFRAGPRRATIAPPWARSPRSTWTPSPRDPVRVAEHRHRRDSDALADTRRP